MRIEDYSRDISLYWPEHIQTMKEFREIDKAANIELKKLWAAANNLMSNRYLSMMNEEECEKLESMLGIRPLPDDTLEDRQRRIKGYFVANTPYTQNKLIEVLNVLCGGAQNYVLLVDAAGYTVHVGVKLASVRLTDNVKEIVNNMVPANMIRDVYVVFNRWKRFESLTWGSLQSETWLGLHEDAKWQEGERR